MKKYKFSVTKNYVSSWGISEAIREILQNAYDSPKKEIIDFDDTISIKNVDTKLQIKTLLMGYGTKTNDETKVGGFSEGSLLSLLVLTRLGYDVVVKNSNELWTPMFEYDETIDEEIFIVQVDEGKYPNNNDLIFEISGVDDYIIDELKNEFVGIDNKSYSHIKTNYGEILKDPEYKGRMFVNGLPIMKDDKFDFGYNFKTEYVKLDRDRKSINLRELYEIVALAITTMEEPDYAMIDELVDNGRDDTKYLVDRNISLQDEFIDGYYEHLSEKFDIDDKTVVVNKESKQIIDEIERKISNGEDIKLVKTNRALYADIINRKNTYSSNYINTIHNDVSTRSSYDYAMSRYNDSEYLRLQEWFNQYIIEPSYEARRDFNKILEELEPYDFDLIKDDIKYGKGV